MFKKLIVFSIALGVFISTKNAVASTSSIMLNAENGKVMYETNADELRYPASLTKLMTLYITFNALENGRLKLTDKLKVSRVAAGRSPSKLGVRAGETISVKDAIMAVIIKSANDCATVLAEHFSKSEADFAVLMTKTAKKLNMNHTTFKNASGLPNSQQKTTARDMSKLAMAVYHHFPQYYKWFSLQSFRYKGQLITGHNHLLKTFSGADGMKTGYTAAAGYNIITSAKRNQKRVIAVTMGHKYLNERDKKAAVMMDKGLEALKKSSWVNVATLTNEINGNKTTQIASIKSRSLNYVPLYAKPLRAAEKIVDKTIIAEGGESAPKLAEATNSYSVINYVPLYAKPLQLAENVINGDITESLLTSAEADTAVSAKIYIPLYAKPARQTRAAQTAVSTSSSAATGGYAVQIGSFSDYKRAKNYANGVKNDIAKKYAVFRVEVEEANNASGKMYRSKLAGMSKNTANKICNSLKNQKKNCLVVAQNSSINWAQK